MVYGTGTVIARMAHAHLGHGGAFEACPQCHAVRWAPAEGRGILVTVADGRLVEDSAVIRRLLVPSPSEPEQVGERSDRGLRVWDRIKGGILRLQVRGRLRR